MEPFNIKIQNETQNAGRPVNQEVTQNADGSGGPISIAKKKDACYRKAKAKYDVFPSAYASGYIAKCRKRRGKLG
jgi:hypothetical protein